MATKPAQQESSQGANPISGMKTIAEFCADNGCSRGFVYTEHWAGRLPFTKLGRATRIKREDEQAWLNSLPVVGAA
tara:strand:- start:243 stop:470 length:228 start_codon:yes stop_codon:yes gene_type:complete